MADEAKKYELAYLLSPLLSEEEALASSGKLASVIEDAKGLVRHREDPKKRKLSYLVKKHTTAYFGWITFSIAPDLVNNVEKKLKETNELIRHLLVIEEEIPPQPIRTFTPRPVPGTKTKPPMPPDAGKQPDEKLDLEELDKKLEEILGK